MSVKIKVGEFDVLSSGSVIGIPGQDFVFEVYGKKYTFTLKKDPNDSSAIWRPINDQHYELTNYDSSIGKEAEWKVAMGEVVGADSEGKELNVELYLMFRVYPSFRVDTGIFHYTWLTRPIS